MSAQRDRELAHWLDQATRGLPQAVAAQTRAEIAAHYEDAYEDYREQSMSEQQAHHQALADLGQAELTADGLRAVHRGPLHYRVAAVASMVFLFMYFVLPSIFQSSGGGSEAALDVLDLVSMGIMVYVMVVLRWLVRWRWAEGDGIETAFRLTIGGIIGNMVAGILSLVLLGTDAHLNVSHTVFTVTGFLPALTLAMVQISWLATGVGTIYLGLKIMPTSGVLYGLEKPVAFLSIMMGLCMIAITALAYLTTTKIVLLVFVGVWLVHATIWPLLTLVFFRAVYRVPLDRRGLA